MKNQSCARAEYQLIMRHNPDSPQAHILTGEGLDQQGKSHEALLEFEQAEKLSPNDPNILFALGYLYWKLRAYDNARRELTRAVAADPQDPRALAYLGDSVWKNHFPAGRPRSRR